MSNVANVHDVVKYDGKNKPLDGQVLLTYTFKKVTKDSMAATDYGLPVDFKPQNSAASVPRITDAELLAAASELVPFMQDLVHDTRRTILRDVVLTAESATKKGQPASWVLSTDQVSLAAVIKKLQEEATSGSSGRFSKAVLEDWFNGVVAPVLLQGMMLKQGIPDTEPDDSPRMLKLLSILQAVFDTLADVVFSKKKPSQDVLDKIDLVLSKVVAAGVTVDSDSTLKLVTDKVESWKGKVTEDWLDAL